MGFVIEDIPEEKREKYGVVTIPGKIPLSRWVIDHENNALLIRRSSHGRGEAYDYDLYWNDEVINLRLHQKIQSEKKKDDCIIVDLILDLQSVTAPKNLESKLIMIKHLIETSLIAYGWNACPELTGTVSIRNLDTLTIQFRNATIRKHH